MSQSRDSLVPVIYEHAFVYDGRSVKIYSTSELLPKAPQAYIMASGFLMNGYVCFVYDDHIDRKIYYFEAKNPNPSELKSIPFYPENTQQCSYTEAEIDSFISNRIKYSHNKQTADTDIPAFFLDLAKQEKKLAEVFLLARLKSVLVNNIKKSVAKAVEESTVLNLDKSTFIVEGFEGKISLDFNNAMLDSNVLNPYSLSQITVLLDQFLIQAKKNLETQDYEKVRDAIKYIPKEGEYYSIETSLWGGWGNDSFKFSELALQIEAAVDATKVAELQEIELEKERKEQKDKALKAESARIQAIAKQEEKVIERKMKKEQSQSPSSSVSPSGKKVNHTCQSNRIRYELNLLWMQENDADLILIIKNYIAGLVIHDSITEHDADSMIADNKKKILNVIANKERFSELCRLAREHEKLLRIDSGKILESISLVGLVDEKSSKVNDEVLNSQIQHLKLFNTSRTLQNLIQSEDFENFVNALKKSDCYEPDFPLSSRSFAPISFPKSYRSKPINSHSLNKPSISSDEYNPYNQFTALKNRILSPGNTLDDCILMKAQIDEAIKLGPEHFKRKAELVHQLVKFKTQFEENDQVINSFFKEKMLSHAHYKSHRETAVVNASALGEQFTQEDASKQNAWVALQNEYKEAFQSEEIKAELTSLINELQTFSDMKKLHSRVCELHKKIIDLPKRQKEWLPEKLKRAHFQNADVDGGFCDLEFNLQAVLDDGQVSYSSYSAGKNIEERIAESEQELKAAHNAFLNGRKLYYSVREKYNEQLKKNQSFEYECTHNNLIFVGDIPELTQFTKIDLKTKQTVTTSSDEPMPEADNIQSEPVKLCSDEMEGVDNFENFKNSDSSSDQGYTGFEFEFYPELESKLTSSHSEDHSHSQDPLSQDSSDHEHEMVTPEQVLMCLNSCNALLKQCELEGKRYTEIKKEAITLNESRKYAVEDMKEILVHAATSFSQLDSIVSACSDLLPISQNTKECIVKNGYLALDQVINESNHVEVILSTMQELFDFLQNGNLFLTELQIQSYQKHIKDLYRDFELQIICIEIEDLQNTVNLASERIEARKACLQNARKLSDTLTASRRKSELLLKEISEANLELSPEDLNPLPKYLVDKFLKLQSDYVEKIGAYHKDIQKRNGELFTKTQKIRNSRLGGNEELSNFDLHKLCSEILASHVANDDNSNLQNFKDAWQEDCVSIIDAWKKFNVVKSCIAEGLSNANKSLQLMLDRISFLKQKQIFDQPLDCSGAPVVQHYYTILEKIYKKINLKSEDLCQKYKDLSYKLTQIDKYDFNQAAQLETDMNTFSQLNQSLFDECFTHLTYSIEGNSYTYFFGGDIYPQNNTAIVVARDREFTKKITAASDLYAYLSKSSHCIKPANSAVANEISTAKRTYKSKINDAKTEQEKAIASCGFLKAVSAAVNQPSANSPISVNPKEPKYTSACKKAGQECIKGLQGALHPDPNGGDIDFSQDMLKVKKLEEMPQPLSFWNRYGGYISGAACIFGGLVLIGTGIAATVATFGAGSWLGIGLIGAGVGAIALGEGMIVANDYADRSLGADERPTTVQHIHLPPPVPARRTSPQPIKNTRGQSVSPPDNGFGGTPLSLLGSPQKSRENTPVNTPHNSLSKSWAGNN